MSTNGIGFDVIVVGSCITDLIAYTSRFPNMGETIRGKKFSVNCGGKGANQAVCASRLGAKTAILCRVGDDSFGRDHIANFKSEKINYHYTLVTEGVPTGVANITVDEEGRNAIVTITGANKNLSVQDVFGASPSHFSGTKVLLCELEIPLDVALYTLKLASDHNVITILTPAPLIHTINAEMFQNCDWIIPNEVEAETLTGSSIRSTDEAKIATKRLREKGCKNIIITCGADGAIFLSEHSKVAVHIPAPSIDQESVLDTTGAGDAFAGSFAYFLSKLDQSQLCDIDNIYAIISKSCAVATYSVQRLGTMSSYPSQADIKLKDLA